MEGKFLILRLSLLISLFIVDLFALDVLVSKKALNFEEKIKTSSLRIMKIKQLTKACVPLRLAHLNKKDYVSTHYINKNSIICLKDVKKYKKESVVFNFGLLEIEKKGKIIFENDKFIRIKKSNGKIEKIYKDGRLK
jgi:hypothetical protein